MDLLESPGPAPEFGAAREKGKRTKGTSPALSHSQCHCYGGFECSYRRRRVQAKGAILVLILNALVDISVSGSLTKVFLLFLKRFDTNPDGLVIFLVQVFTNSIPYILLYPIAGWLADTRFGRFTMIRSCVWILWSGFIVLFVAFFLSYFIDNSGFDKFAYYGVFPVVFLAVNVGLAGFQANIIPFGLDQMPTGSAEEMSAFIHWYYFTRNIGAGIVLTILVCTAPVEVSVVVQSAVETGCLTVALIVIYCLKKWLILGPRSSDNPFSTVQSVVKYAWKHKSPVNRSSLTYWEDKLPSRIDLGKSKYGGPFTTEKVEDVKVFLRISVILVCLGGFIIIFNTNVSLFVGHFKDVKISNPQCTLGTVLLSELNYIPILIFLPIYEFLVYPLLSKYIPTTLRRIAVGFVILMVAVDGPLLVVDAYEHSISSLNSSTCFLVNSSSVIQNLNIESSFLALPYTFAAIAEMLVFIGALEFISAQSPCNMHGMLIGVYYCVRGVFSLASNSITLFFSLGYAPKPAIGPPSCGTIYFSLLIVLAVIGLVVYIAVARRYRRRQRDDDDQLFNQHIFVENYYGSLTEY